MKKKNILSPAVARVCGLRAACVAGLVLALSACGNSDYYRFATLPDGTELVNPGRVAIALQGLDNAPAATRIHLYAPNAQTDAQGNLIPLLALAPGETADLNEGLYHLLAVVPPTEGAMDGIVIGLDQQRHITAELVPAEAVRASEVLPRGSIALPEVREVLAATGTVSIVPGEVTDCALSPQPLARRVALRILTQGIDPAEIVTIGAQLHGVLRRLAGVEAVSSVTAAAGHYHTTVALSATATPGQWTHTFGLLGIDPSASQLLSISVQLKSGDALRFDQDVSTLFTNFNTQPIGEELKLEATISFGIDGLQGTITPWAPGWNEGGTGM